MASASGSSRSGKPRKAAPGLRASLERRERELQTLARVAERILPAEDAHEILEIALEEILARLDLQAGWVLLADDGGRRLRLAAHRGLDPGYLEQIERDGLGDCLCPKVFVSGQAAQAHNQADCPRMPRIGSEVGASTVHACIPLVVDGVARGVLNGAAGGGDAFSEGQLRFLETLGHQVCLAMERARHLRLERLRNQEARAMAAINKAIGGSLDARAVLEAVGETAREVLGADRVRIFLGQDPRHLEVAHLSGLPQAGLELGQVLDLIKLGATLTTLTFEVRRAFAVDDSRTDQRLNRAVAERWGDASVVMVPLLARERTLGVLMLSRAVAHQWTPEQLEVAEALAAQASVALENVRLYEEARRSYEELKSAQAHIIRNEKMAVLGTFASGLAHEVRNPLNSIALQLSLLERRTGSLEPVLSGKIRELTDIIRQEVKRLDGLVSDFLLFSRASATHHRPANIESLLDEVVRLLRPEARATGVSLRRQGLGTPIPSVPMDAEKMKQVVINLVRNAIEAMPDGGLVVVEDGVVGGRACLVVRDDGPGLPEGIDVFQLFVTTKARGTGLGLSIAQQIVAEHGGEITVRTEPGAGASFTVCLPIPQSAEPTPSRM
jgi:signal transduction histidine kinase